MLLEPRCRHFRACGGCTNQHVPYESQLLQKEAFVNACFGQKTESILPANPFWHYRNKMEFSFSQARSGEKFLGLMKKRARVENIEECFLTSFWGTEIVQKVRAWWKGTAVQAYHPPTNSGLLRTLTVREGLRTGEKMVMLTVSEAFFSEQDISSFVEAIGPCDSILLRKQVIQKKIPTRFEERLLKGKNYIHESLKDSKGHQFLFRIKGTSFFQPNTAQAECIYQKALEYAALDPSEKILDLYCGTGSIGIFASRQTNKVLGIEIIPEAVQDAHANMTLNAVSNMSIIEGDVAACLADLPFLPETVFVDPPRVGLGSKTIQHLRTLKPNKIVYISCNPVTQATDCATLDDYVIARIQPIDQFPHTPHIENIVLLVRKTAL